MAVGNWSSWQLDRHLVQIQSIGILWNMSVHVLLSDLHKRVNIRKFIYEIESVCFHLCEGSKISLLEIYRNFKSGINCIWFAWILFKMDSWICIGNDPLTPLVQLRIDTYQLNFKFKFWVFIDPAYSIVSWGIKGNVIEQTKTDWLIGK